MKYAIISSLGGELIKADNADYEHYKDFLKCPICCEVVFLRKAYKKQGKRVSAAFIHHKNAFDVLACELRVSKYTKKEIEAINSEARGQRIAKLRISLWKFLKTNLAIDCTRWSLYKKQLEGISVGVELIDFGLEILNTNKEYLVNEALKVVQSLFFNKDKKIGVCRDKSEKVNTFIERNKNRWGMHYKITQEVLEAFLFSPDFIEIRKRLMSVLCHPECLTAIEGLIDLNIESREWREKFLHYTTLQVCVIFITVDWIEIFKD